MIVPIGTALSCRFADETDPAAADVPVASVVVRSEEGEAVVRAEDAGRFRPGRSVEARYPVPDSGQCMVAAGSVSQVAPTGEVTLAWRGEPVMSNSRASFRIGTRCSDVRADIGRRRACPVLDVSLSGLSAEVRDAPEAGALVEIILHGFGRTVSGRFVVRNARAVRMSPDGPVWRCGFEVGAGQPGLVRALRDIVMEAQRAQLRNRSRIGAAAGPETPGAPDAPPVDADIAPAGSSPAGDEVRVRFPIERMIGRAMPASLSDADGRVVLTRGTVLDEDILAGLSVRELEMCDDWLEVEAGDGPERRRAERRSCRVSVQVWLADADGGVRCLQADMTDISRGGVGLVTAAVVHRGDVLVVDFADRGPRGWIVARVENSTVTPDGASCRLGVRFLQTRIEKGPLPDAAGLVRALEPFRATARARTLRKA
jgi:hypothetical protein